MTTAVQLAQQVAPGVSLGFKNRIINGGMTIDQRNAGASLSISTSGVFGLDRWVNRANGGGVYTVQQSTTAPAGFKNSSKYTVTTPDASIAAGDNYWIIQTVEGLNCSDFNYGTANAQTVTVSFWVRSSVTGTYSVSLTNNPSYDRSYVATYSISAADTWEQKSITIPGDVTGTWNTSNTGGVALVFNLGTGSTYQTTAGSWQSGFLQGTSATTQWIATNGATFYITGVQLEVGTAATSFELRDYERELIMCQRYFQKSYDQGTVGGTATFTGFTGRNGTANGAYFTTGEIINEAKFSVTMRTAPSLSIWDGAGNASKVTRTAFGVADYNNQGTYQTQNIYDRGFSLQSGSGSNACCVSCQYYASAEL